MSVAPVLHRLELSEPGTLIGARVVCLGGPDDICRQWCAEGCEEQCYEMPIPHPQHKELCPQAPVDGHQWEPIGSCRIADWLNAGDLDESIEDEDLLQFDEDGEKQPGLHSGLINAYWDGDDYLWDYVEEGAA